MNRKVSMILTTLGLLSFVNFSLLAQGGPTNRNRVLGNGLCGACGAATTLSGTLTEDEKTWLLFMREEEKLARDVYQVLAEKYNLRIFANIAQSEQRHFDAIGTLIQRYELVDPADSKGTGVFSNLELQGLYILLTTPGPQSVMEALSVGVGIEEQDIEDLKVAIGATNKTDIIRVYSNLLNGSERHLDAFQSHLQVLGVNP